MPKTKPTTTGDIRESLTEIIRGVGDFYLNFERNKMEARTVGLTSEEAVQKIVALIQEEKGRAEHKAQWFREEATRLQKEQSTDEDKMRRKFKATNWNCTGLHEQSTDKPVDNLMNNEIDYCIRPGTRPNCTCKTCQPLEEKLSKCCSAPMITRGDTETRGSTCWYECSRCHEPTDELYTEGGKKSPKADKDTDIDGDKEEQPLTCYRHSRILIGKNKCIDCEWEEREHQIMIDTLLVEKKRAVKEAKQAVNNKLHKQGYDDCKRAILNDLRQIVEKNHDDNDTYDYDGIAEDIIKYIKKYKVL